MKYKLNTRGFTLIEMLMVIVILGILLSIGIPNMINARTRAREANVKTNMHAIQTVIEMYSLAWGSRYPVDMDAFEAEPSIATELQSIDEIANPFNQRTGRGNAYDDESVSKFAGLVTYDGGYDTVYYLYGYGNNGNRVTVKGVELVLSNS